jgi:phage-related minor tail protein
VAAASAKVTTDSAVLGGVAVAKQAIEFLAAVIGLIGGLGVLVGWLS